MKIRHLYNSNESIINGLKSSSDSVLNYLYKEYLPMIRNLVITNSGTKDDANDILQDGIIVIYEKAKNNELDLTCTVKTYLYSVCRNLWLKELRKSGKQVSFNEIHNETIPVIDETEEKENLSKQQQIIEKLIDQIGESYKQILIYFFYEKLSMNEIADKMGYTNAGNAKTQKYKCLKKLQKMALEQYQKENIINL